MIYSVILATLVGVSSAQDMEQCLEAMMGTVMTFVDCYGDGGDPNNPFAVFTKFDDPNFLQTELCKNDGKLGDCMMKMVRALGNFEKENPQCAGDTNEGGMNMSELEVQLESYLGQDGLLCMKDENGDSCMELIQNMENTEVSDPCALAKTSCCYTSYFQYTVHCGIAEDTGDFENTCPDVDLTATCPGSNIKGMACFEEAKEAPSQFADLTAIEEFCETGSMKVDQEKCSLWSCCEWDGECFASIATVGSECSCGGDGSACDASIAQTFKEGEGSGAVSVLPGLAAIVAIFIAFF